MTDIPDWAWKMLDDQIDLNQPPARIADQARCIAVRYIAEYEQPPVDPLLIEAREIVASQYELDGISYHLAHDARGGYGDDWFQTKACLRAIKRGIEIGKGEK